MSHVPDSWWAEKAKAKRQARALRDMRLAVDEEIGVSLLPAKVDTWLGGFGELFPGERSDATRYHDAAAVAPFRRVYGDRRMSSITPIEAQQWALDHPSQVRHLERAWDFAVLMRVAPINVWKRVTMPKRTKEKVRPPTDVELARILATCAAFADKNHAAFADMIIVAAYTGARLGGVIGLRRCDVDLEAGTLTLTEKGSKTRTALLLGPARDAMQRQFGRRYLEGWAGAGRANAANGGQKSPLVWIAVQRKAMTPRVVQALWSKVRGDFPHGFHSLRHHASTWMKAQGMDSLDVAVQLGHTDSQGRPYVRHIERRYDHPNPEASLARVAAAAASHGLFEATP